MSQDDHDFALPDSLKPADLRALSAFIDGELPQGTRAAVLEHLAQDPEAAAQVEAWRSQKSALQALCGGVSQRDATDGPPSFVVVRVAPPWWRRISLAACWLAVGAGLALAERLDRCPADELCPARGRRLRGVHTRTAPSGRGRG